MADLEKLAASSAFDIREDCWQIGYEEAEEAEAGIRSQLEEKPRSHCELLCVAALANTPRHKV